MRSPFICQSASHWTKVYQPERVWQRQKGTILCTVYSVSPSRVIQIVSLSGCCRLSCSGPYQSIIPSWMQDSPRLHESDVTVTTYLVLRNAVNRLAEWGTNVFLYSDIMNASWKNDLWGGRCLKQQVWLCCGQVSLPWWFIDTAHHTELI